MTQNNLTLATAQTAPEFRMMYMSDLNSVVKIISAHDDDDGEAAEADYQNEGVENQYVLIANDQLIGVTGYRPIEASEQSYWLSWTYLDKSFQGKGLGKLMLNNLFDVLTAKGCRKIFVKVSDYTEPGLACIYQNAFKTYESLGFIEELINNDFYDEDENQHILGLSFNEDADFEDATKKDDSPEIADEKPIIRFNGLYEIAETEDVYTFSWIVNKKKGFFNKRNFTTEDLIIGLENVKNESGRKVFLTFPSNLPLIHTPLQAAGFKFVGRLTDYYEQGVHEFHFSHDLTNIGNINNE